MTGQIKEVLASAAHLSLTIDIWSDRRCHSFFAATVHCFKNFSSQSMLLSFISFKGSHTSAIISEELESIEAKNGIAGKVDYVVIDNAANMKKAFIVSSCFQFDDDHHDDSSIVVGTGEQLDDDPV